MPELIELVDWFRENYTEGAKLQETAQAIADVAEWAGEKISTFSNTVEGLSIVLAFGAQQALAYYDILSSLASLDFTAAANAKDRLLSNVGALAGSLGDIGRDAVDSGTTSRGSRGARGLGGSRSTGSSRDYISAARSLQAPTPKASKAARGKKDNSEEERLRAEKKAAEDYRAAIEALNSVLDDQAKITGGDLTKAAMDYRNEMVKILETEEKLKELGKLDAETQAAITQARDQATASYNREIEAINAKKTPAEEMLADLQFELELLGMTNAEREKAIALRHANATAASAEGIAISEALDKLDQAQEVAEGMDVLRQSTSNLFSDLMSGAKSAKEAFGDFLDSIIAGISNMIA